MKRRDVIKGVAAAAGALYLETGLLASGENRNEAEQTPFATPIRALTKKDGGLKQPVQLRIGNAGPEATCVTRVDGLAVDRRILPAGQNTFNVYLPPVLSARQVHVECEIAGRSLTSDVRLEPVRKLQIFILPHSQELAASGPMGGRVELDHWRDVGNTRRAADRGGISFGHGAGIADPS